LIILVHLLLFIIYIIRFAVKKYYLIFLLSYANLINIEQHILWNRNTVSKGQRTYWTCGSWSICSLSTPLAVAFDLCIR